MSDRFRPVPQGRLARLAAFGQIAGGVATGVVGEGLRRLAQGERPQLADLLLTPSNALRVTDQLSRLRGAAMKLGQMISLDAGDMLPAELTTILAQLRDGAHVMPPQQLAGTLANAWGADWRRHFVRFDTKPIAAASIGQVHRARLPSGRELAIKVQYPGIAASINADVDNVATLLRMSGLLPAGLDVRPLLAEAKRQLHEEADYLREAEEMRRFRALLSSNDRLLVPEPVDELLRPTVLPMDYIAGEPIETLEQASPERRGSIGQELLDLVLRELFEFGLMQTDPNFANFRWQPDTGRLVLLDFGAARPVSTATSDAYRRLLRAALSQDVDAVLHALSSMGFLSAAQMERHGRTLRVMAQIGLKHLHARPDGLLDFADRSLIPVLRAHTAPIAADRQSFDLPPAEMLFVQRKISGMALLLMRLQMQLPLVETLTRHA
ncbi:ubiquinol-cytochrome C reductase [Rhizobium sp. Root274]|uniref:ABC1 kinase family protein n=1 Tax=unclassified Rhizobium TaxID=2613769 RepID=UPI000712D3E3|nr:MULTISPECIES: AarF/ABC1/UbiB kinase family protein [unclassified Rhizobium]KQW32176.1 ubiquinol-cytochrome C reductase [Rhizobium sp. Root1240]KRD33716.1 ubiquinol-cytochrome C reductase [Rhizobium sp. Root274]